MSREHTSFILGYHGCTKSTGEEVLAGRLALEPSSNPWDWLGPGVYFWEADPQRAWEWAEDMVKRKGTSEPFVLGAIIDLGNCLDLMARGDLELLRSAYDSLSEFHAKSGKMDDLPVNKPINDDDPDDLLRFLDRAVVEHLHEIMDDFGEPSFDTVRGLFTEGEPLFPGSGFKSRTHTQIAVCNRSCIKGYFRVPPDDLTG